MLVCTHKAYYTNVNRIAFITFCQYSKQTGLGKFMRDFLLPAPGNKFCRWA